jgi:hypothetical protein
MMAFGRVAAVPWLGPKEGDERERERGSGTSGGMRPSSGVG